MVSPLQPVMLAVADNFFSAENAFYSPNKYCKWKIRDPGYENLLKVLDANVYPVTEACDYDGFVIYNGPNTSSPKMGQYCTIQIIYIYYSSSKRSLQVSILVTP